MYQSQTDKGIVASPHEVELRLKQVNYRYVSQWTVAKSPFSPRSVDWSYLLKLDRWDRHKVQGTYKPLTPRTLFLAHTEYLYRIEVQVTRTYNYIHTSIPYLPCLWYLRIRIPARTSNKSIMWARAWIPFYHNNNTFILNIPLPIKQYSPARASTSPFRMRRDSSEENA